ncbi:transglycosylase domain-containing protein [Haloferula rosea]|uniref:peptidoglycan glycosyltransferase n=1 Tax=Haloferula rosea TaxID=490093 RepID=A0A934RFP4_9BACT|nr:transglycosylase domain-containing protein [Haloferula rosea]MBK1828324.1 transglycosylase domain-containing protein [Haloferula rosea]
MSKSPSRNKRKKTRFYKRKGFWLTLLLLALITGGIGYIAAERYTRPYRERAATYDLALIDKVEVPSIILGRDGGEIGRIFVQNRSIVTIDKVPENFVNALRAGEDKRFYEHGGFDAIGIARAAIDWFKTGEAVSGASTITQQLARGAFPLEDDRKKNGESSVERKIVEIFLAQRIEKRFPKDKILEYYLNRIYFGSGFYGIRSASLGYFGKEPTDLTDIECATIVGLIKNPTGLSPLNDIDASRRSRNMVIARMLKEDFITATEASRMLGQPIELNPKPLRRGTSHVYERIADEIRVLLGEEGLSEGGLTIRTSIDSRVQQAAEEQLELSLRKAESRQGYTHPTPASKGDPKEYLQGAVLMVDHRNGAVIAHVGGRNYAEVPFDMIELGRRPLGTAFHPFIYASALEAGYTPASAVDDDPMDNRAVMVGGREGILGEWGMEITNPRYEGEITLRRALESSKVAATVRVANQVGLDKVVATSSAFGLPMAEAEQLPRLAVGWESASLKEAVRAYAAFSNGGQLGPEKQWYVSSIKGADGSIRFDRPTLGNNSRAAVSDATAFQIHSILQGGMMRGSAAGAFDELKEIPFNGAGKPGTTHDFSDNWFIGYNGSVSCGVWIGFLQDGKTIYEGAFARELAMPVWSSTMNAARNEFGGRSIPRPNSIVETDVCRISGERSTPYCYEMVQDPATGRLRSKPAAIKEYFRAGTEKLAFCSVHSGSAPVNPAEGAIDLSALAVIDTSPVRPKEPTLLGADPYHSLHVNAENMPEARARSGRTNVLDSFDLDDALEGVELPRPKRLEISPE